MSRITAELGLLLLFSYIFSVFISQVLGCFISSTAVVPKAQLALNQRTYRAKTNFRSSYGSFRIDPFFRASNHRTGFFLTTDSTDFSQHKLLVRQSNDSAAYTPPVTLAVFTIPALSR